ncbi:hypothetical protein Aperf_G00000079397 [Anoplocephala perfoliata]
MDYEFGPATSTRCYTSSKRRNDVFHVDLVSSRFLINPEIDDCMRKLAICLADFIKKKCSTRVIVSYPQYCAESSGSNPFVQVSKNPQIWKCYPKFNVHENYITNFEQMSAFAQSWESIYAIADQFRACRSCIASIPSLRVGLCPDDDQTFIKASSCTTPPGYSYDLRLAIPTLQAGVEYLLATPPSLPWSLVVALEFFRLQAIDGEARGCESSNLPADAVGVLENWINFMLYGSLIDADSEIDDYLSEDWVRSISKSVVQSNSIYPATMTLMFDCSGLVPDTLSAHNLDEQLVQLDKAWQNAVITMKTRGAILVSHEELKNKSMLESIFKKLDVLCHKRFARAMAHRENLEKVESEALIA